jgi:hypothetical protein
VNPKRLIQFEGEDYLPEKVGGLPEGLSRCVGLSLIQLKLPERLISARQFRFVAAGRKKLEALLKVLRGPVGCRLLLSDQGFYAVQHPVRAKPGQARFYSSSCSPQRLSLPTSRPARSMTCKVQVPCAGLPASVASAGRLSSE